MGNGALWVNKGLLDDTTDDELACVLGHELAHYTHEHIRRGARNSMLVRLAAQLTQVGLEHVNSPGKNAALTIGAELALSAWNNGYSRVLEDQAIELAFDTCTNWLRRDTGTTNVAATLERSGQLDRVSNFFRGGIRARPSGSATSSANCV